MDLEYLKQMLIKECNANSNIFTSIFYDKHILAVVNKSLLLGRKYHANLEVVEIAAYMHDIAAVKDPNRLKFHEIDGSVIAEHVLKQQGVVFSIIERVKKCIINHSTPCKTNTDIESMCIANADVLAKLDELPYWFYFQYSVRKSTYAEGLNWINRQIIEKWEKLDEYSKEISLKKYKSLKLLINIK